MRVCFLAPELLPNQGGVGTYSVALLQEMVGAAEFTVLTPLRRKGPETYDRARIEEYFDHRLTAWTVSSAEDTFLYNFAYQRAVRREIARLLKEERFDLIHSQHAHMPDLLVSRSSRRVPTVRTIHTTIAGQRGGIRAAREAGVGLESSERWQLALAPVLQTAEWSIMHRPRDWYLTVSEWMGHELKRTGIPDSRIRVVPTGVETDRFRPDLRDPSRLRSSPSARVVLFPGRPTIVKGAAVLARAIPKVLREMPNVEFAFTGGRAEEFLRIVDLSDEVRRRIRFLGYVPFEELPAIYASADVVVAPTFYENLPARVLEAMASAVPVVASSVGGIPEVVVPGKTGSLSPPGDADALARALLVLLKDDELRTRLGAEARRVVAERFTWRQAGEATLRFYREIVS